MCGVSPERAVRMRADWAIWLLEKRAEMMDAAGSGASGKESFDVNGGIEDLKRKLGIG